MAEAQGAGASELSKVRSTRTEVREAPSTPLGVHSPQDWKRDTVRATGPEASHSRRVLVAMDPEASPPSVYALDWALHKLLQPRDTVSLITAISDMKHVRPRSVCACRAPRARVTTLPTWRSQSFALGTPPSRRIRVVCLALSTAARGRVVSILTRIESF